MQAQRLICLPTYALLNAFVHYTMFLGGFSPIASLPCKLVCVSSADAIIPCPHGFRQLKNPADLLPDCIAGTDFPASVIFYGFNRSLCSYLHKPQTKRLPARGQTQRTRKYLQPYRPYSETRSHYSLRLKRCQSLYSSRFPYIQDFP